MGARRALVVALVVSCRPSAATSPPARSLQPSVMPAASLPARGPAVDAALPSTRDDLRVMRTFDVWTVRETFLGWTPAHVAVTRRMICDPTGGPNGRYCSIGVCEVGPESQCSPALSLYHLERDDQATRLHFDETKAERIVEKMVASSGILEPGTTAPGMRLHLVPSALLLQAVNDADATLVNRVLARIDPGQHTIEDAELLTAAATRDATCIVAVGHYTLVDHGTKARRLERIAVRDCATGGP